MRVELTVHEPDHHQSQADDPTGESARVATALSEQPGVDRAVVMPGRTRDGAVTLTAYVVPAGASPPGGLAGEDTREQVAAWRDVYESLYSRPGETAPQDDFVGWNSSFGDGAIPADEMRAWQEAALAEIREQAPERVLEIGVGSGLLLAPLAPEVKSYWATDFSPATVERLRGHTEAAGWEHVRLRCQPADDVSGLPGGRFDTVVLNSVVQYFPNAGYLIGVLEKVFDLLVPAGRIVLGDVRHLGLLRTLHTAAVLHQQRAAGAAVDLAALNTRIDRAMIMDKELLVAPEFFANWAGARPDCAGADIRLKRGTARNELTRFRYEVVLHKVPAAATSAADVDTLAWDGDLDALGDRVRAECATGRRLRVTGIPNARIADDVAAMWDLAEGGSGRINPATGAVDPEALHRWAADRGARVLSTWSAASLDSFDSVFAPRAGTALVPARWPERAGWPVRGLISDPVGARHTRKQVTGLHRALAGRLTDVAAPVRIVLLDELPLTAGGEVEWRALPTPDHLVASGLVRLV